MVFAYSSEGSNAIYRSLSARFFCNETFEFLHRPFMKNFSSYLKKVQMV